MTGDAPDQKTLGDIATNYVSQLASFLEKYDLLPGEFRKSLDPPVGWGENLVRNKDRTLPDVDLMHWLDVWPHVGAREVEKPPKIASWNLSRNADHQLPATIIMVATELFELGSEIAQFTAGLTVPMLVEATGAGIFKVTIRSMTAEYPSDPQQSWSTVSEITELSDPAIRQDLLSAMIGDLTTYESDINKQIGASASVLPGSVSFEQFFVVSKVNADFAKEPMVIEAMFKGLGEIERFPNPLSYQIVSQIELTLVNPAPDFKFSMKVLGTQTCELITHVNAGEARVLTQSPPASDLPADSAKPDAAFDWTLRRPTRPDDMLDRFRETIKLSVGDTKTLKDTGFVVQRCPVFVPQDKEDLGNPDPTKVLHLPAHREIAPRRNEFSALSAYYNCSDFFEMLSAYGIDPDEFVARAETDIQIFYRYGIAPGPGKDGRTINAQVAFDCSATDATRPVIRMNLALAELSRWDRPKNSSGKRTWAQPLGIAADRRWMLHEFGHYLLAARLGKLEFDFAHSAGDAMAAIICDPNSRLADQRNGVAESFRGITYPFVFSTRRHDRSPTLGWAWYGELNRSVIQSPPVGCEELKGYLTEQILSTSLFRLYRAVGGDSMDGDVPDVYLRERASFLTIFLLMEAIHGFGQSPSKAEMLELGMEQAGNLQGGVLDMVPQPMLANAMQKPDQWKGGLTHKVVRWAFETQGMFVDDVEVTRNGMGNAPDVDVYIQDRRPQSEMVNGSSFAYGYGSYCPVSLDWGDAPLWQTPFEITIGNRGSKNAALCHMRKWFGFVFNANEDWGLTSNIIWWPHALNENVADIAAGERRTFTAENANAENEAIAAIRALADEQAPTLATVHGFVLYELTCPNDRANTDPLQDLPVAVDLSVADLPKTPRALTDLVANDNNLGLKQVF
ncbi:hypothetical protein [Tateyamaria sp.]|uniref:hypothetical protein n=1 Tax=Tateyamaria sp. TaxID=1929288 RepID=UPI00329E3071